MRSFSPVPSRRPSCFLLLVVFILLLLTSFETSESCPLPLQVGDCLSLLVLLEGQRCGSLSSGTVVGRVSSSLYQDLLLFLLALPIFSWFSFKTEFMKAQSCCIPQRKITPNETKQPEWFNRSIAEAISNRQKAYNISKLRPSPETKVAHIKECRNVDKLIRRAKLNEEDRVAAAAKDNPKAFFAHVTSRKPVKNTIGPLKDRTGSIISSDEGMANILNEYFTSGFTEEDTSEIPIVPIVYRGNNPLRKIEITVNKVKMKLKKLNSNKSAGPDGFYPRVIKETEEETAPHFCNIFRTSLEQRKAVRDWKLQNISPLFEKGSKDDPGNY